MSEKSSVGQLQRRTFRRTELNHLLPRRNRELVQQLGREDLVESATIVVTPDDIAEVDELSPFSPEHMQQFVAFVGAGLPEVFLRSHPDLLDSTKLDEIEEVINDISDPSLQRYLRSRLVFLEEYAKAQEARIARLSDKKKPGLKTSKP